MKRTSFSFLSLAAITLSAFFVSAAQRPQLTVIMVIDQGAYYHFSQRMNCYKYGIKKLFDNGIVYTDAHMPHALPTTAVGHAALNTGTFAQYHGFCRNTWRTPQGERIHCDLDPSAHAAVINPRAENLFYPFGRSAVNLMVDGLSDQFMLSRNDANKRAAYALSGKSRSAIATAGRMAKAIWFDHHAGLFTSSKAYFNQLPAWLQRFNKESIAIPPMIAWKQFYEPNSPCYASVNPHSYRFSNKPIGLVNQEIPSIITDKKGKLSYDSFLATPPGIQLILDLALHCITTHIKSDGGDNQSELLVWVCLSGYDPVGHAYGPESLEAIDMLYHIDKQIGRFMEQVETVVDPQKILFALSADHGISPIPELVHEKGFTAARRILVGDLIKKTNRFMRYQQGVFSLLSAYDPPYLYLNKGSLAGKNQKEKDEVVQAMIAYIQRTFPGIKSIVPTESMLKATYEQHSFESFFQKQIYPGRVGDLVVQTFPYVLLTDRPGGTAHQTPYNYDTHVPLILYQKGSLENKVIAEKVFITQFANTLARILGIAPPSASTSPLLPGIFDHE